MDQEMLSVGLPVRFLSAGQCFEPGCWNQSPPAPRSSLLIVRDAGPGGKAPPSPSRGQALFLPSGCGVLPEGFGAGGPARYFWLRFQSAGPSAATQVRLSLFPVPLGESAFNRFSYGFHQLVGAGAGLSASSDLCDYMLSVLLLSLREAEPPAPRNAVAARMLDYIRLHCCEPLTLPDVSRALGYSEDYLSRLLHQHVSCSFRQYIHRLRMQRAKKELLSGVKSVQEIAEECGYSNAKFFSTSFLKCEGIAPSAYRNLYASGFVRESAEN